MDDAPEGASVSAIAGAFFARGHDEVGEQVVAVCSVGCDELLVCAQREDGEEGDEEGGEDACDDAFPRHSHARPTAGYQ